MTGLMKKDWRQAHEPLKCWVRPSRYSGQDNGSGSSESRRLSNLRKAYQGEASYVQRLQSPSSTRHVSKPTIWIIEGDHMASSGDIRGASWCDITLISLRGALLSVWTLGSHCVARQQSHHCQHHAYPVLRRYDIRLNYHM